MIFERHFEDGKEIMTSKEVVNKVMAKEVTNQPTLGSIDAEPY